MAHSAGDSTWFMGVLVPLVIVSTSVKSSYAICLDKPILEDSCYARASEMGMLIWNPPHSCTSVDKYEVLYTKSVCNASEAAVERVQQNETTILLTSSDVYCIRVRAVTNDNCFSDNSKCAQVAQLEQDHLSNVGMHGRLCIPVSICQEDQPVRHPSKIILSNSREQLHLTWNSLTMRPNVNRTYNTTTRSYQFCFYNVTENFLFLEYCDVDRVQHCESGATFCCENWAEFISRTRVNVTGDSYVATSPSMVSATPASIARSSTAPYTTVMSSNTPSATPSTPSEDTDLGIILGVLLPVLIALIIIVLIVIALWYRDCRSKKTTPSKTV